VSAADWAVFASAFAVAASWLSLWFAYQARSAAERAIRQAESAAQWTTQTSGEDQP
jgi:hypothetical protein